MASWKESCPLDGSCGECGLGFAWADILTESAYRPSWCVEFAPRRRLVAAAAATLIMVFVPWKLWASIRMAHAVEGRRLAVYLGFVLAILYLMFALSHGVIVHQYWMACFDPKTAPAAVGGTAATNSMPVGEATVRSILLPISPEPLGQRTDSQGTWPWYSPWDMRTFWWEAWPVLVYGLIVIAISLCILVLFSVSSRAAVVPVVHIGRVAAYWAGVSLGFWGLGVAWTLAYWQNTWFAGPVTAAWVRVDDFVMMAGVPILVFVWWHAAIHRYLRMSHSRMIAATITVIAVGGGLVPMWFIDPGLVRGIFFHLMQLVGR